MEETLPPPEPPSARSLEQLSKIWISLPQGLCHASASEIQHLNEICCFNIEQVYVVISSIIFFYIVCFFLLIGFSPRENIEPHDQSFCF